RLDTYHDLPGWNDLTKIFLNLCSSTLGILFIVFDALDECDETTNRAPVIELLTSLISSKVRLLITSRSYPPDIGHLLRDCAKITVEASPSDIRAFLLDQIVKSARMSRVINKNLQEEIV